MSNSACPICSKPAIEKPLLFNTYLACPEHGDLAALRVSNKVDSPSPQKRERYDGSDIWGVLPTRRPFKVGDAVRIIKSNQIHGDPPLGFVTTLLEPPLPSSAGVIAWDQGWNHKSGNKAWCVDADQIEHA